VSLSISNPFPFPEGDTGTSDMLFVVTRSGDLAPTVRVDFATQDGTGVNGARAGTDYVATTGTLVFASNQATATIAVPVLGNTILQSNRTFTVTLSDPLSSADFAAAQTFATGSQPRTVATADLNGDGKPDLVVAQGGTPGEVAVLLNTTAPGASGPTFGAPQTLPVGNYPIDVVVADLNGDGKPDIITANNADNTVSVLFNITTPGATAPSFSTQQTFATGIGPTGVTARDVNGDGLPDLIVANRSDNTVSVLLNTTTPGAVTPNFANQQTFAAGVGPYRVATGDVNGDGVPDLVVGNFNSGTVSVLLNTTAPGAAVVRFASQQTFTTGGNPVAVTLGDVNGDGRADIVVASYGSNTVSVLLNTTTPGAATPSFAPQQTFAVGNTPRSVILKDVNGDNKPDILVANSSDNTVSVLLNESVAGLGTALSFARQQTFSTGRGPYAVAMADLNGDGIPDLITADLGGDVSVLLGTFAPPTVTPIFATQTTFAVQLDPYSVAVGDLNGDGKPDLVVANRNSNTVSVLLNTTAPGATIPTFAPQTTFAIGSLAHIVVLGDLNGDGKLDIVTANANSGSVSVLLNMTAPGAATPSFLPQQTFATNSGPLGLTLADVNGDGKLDLITCDSDFVATVSVLLNTTAPGAPSVSFTAFKTFATGALPYSVAAADINGDGKPDLVVANAAGNSVSVLLNTTATGASTPSFAPQQTFATGTGSEPIAVAVGDLNGDGLPDIAVANELNGTASVLINTTAPGASTTSFSPQQTFAVGYVPFGVALGDLNGDGKPDLLVANLGGNNIRILLNTTAPGATTPSFATQPTIGVGANPPFVALTDLNGDFNPDLIVANRNDDDVGVLLNTTPALTLSISNATATGTIQDDDAPVTVTAVAGNNQSANISTAFATPLTVDVKNAAGNLVQGVNVTFTVPTTGASGTFTGGLTSVVVTTGANGQATAPTFTANATPGVYSVTATASGGSNPSTTFTLTNLGPPASVTPTAGTPQSTTVNTAFATALKAVVKDSAGDLLSGVSVTFTAPTTGASGTFTGSATVITNSLGVAMAPTFTANAVAGAYHVTATVNGGTHPSTTLALTNTAAGSAKLAFKVQPATTTAGVFISPAVKVQVLDSFGNLTGSTALVSLTVAGPAGFAAGSVTAVNAVAGVATFSSLKFTKSGIYTLTAHSTGLTGAVSVSFRINPAAPAKLTYVGGSPLFTTIGATAVGILKVLVQDAFGNVVPSAIVTFIAPTTGPSGTFGGSSRMNVVTDANGIATVAAFTPNRLQGSYTIFATLGTLVLDIVATNRFVTITRV
jgi:hypothetical protein